MLGKHPPRFSRPTLITALLAGALFAAGASVFASTTIGSNINTGGTLTVTGATTLNGNVGVGTTAPLAQLHLLAGASGTKGFIAQGAPSATTFNYTGGQQTYIVPAGVTKVNVTALGARGGNQVCGGRINTSGGGRTRAAITVTPGETLYVYVGGIGGDTTNPAGNVAGGFNGGGNGGTSVNGCYAGGGGGASDVRRGGVTITPTDFRVVVAGGGGALGGGGSGGAAGGGGGLVGGAGGIGSGQSPVAGGGTQSAGGAGGQASASNNCTSAGSAGSAGSLGVGGTGGVNDSAASGGGGGGGYYGGGGGCGSPSFNAGGGGGGSGYASGTNVSHENNVNVAAGQIVITPVSDLAEYQDSGANVLTAVDTSGYLMVGTTTSPGGNTRALITDTTQAAARLTFSGQEFYQTSNTSSDGIAFLLGQNRSNNRQLWLADSANLYQNTTNGTLWFNPTTSGYSSIGARATDGSTNLNLALQPNGGNVSVATTSPYSQLTVWGRGTGTGQTFAVVNNASTTLLQVLDNGQTGLATTSPWRTLSVVGTLGLSSSLTTGTTGNYLCINTSNYEITSGTTCSASSERFKENIKLLSYGLDTLLKLRPVSFTYKEQYNPDHSTKLGFIAEQVNLLIPELVAKDKDGLSESVDYAKLAPVLTKAIQELNTKVDILSLFSGSQPVSPSSFFLSLVANPLKDLGILIEDGVLRAREFVADKMSSKEVWTNQLCLGATCLHEDELKSLLDLRNQQPHPSATNADSSPTPTPPTPASPTSTPSLQTATSSTSTEQFAVTVSPSASSTPLSTATTTTTSAQ